MILKQLTNKKELWDAFCEELDNRIEVAHRGIEQSKDLEDIYRYQGEIRNLRRLKQLRDQVNGRKD